MYLVHFLSTLVDDFAALHCAHFVSLPNFGFEMKIRTSGFDISDSDSIRNQLRFDYGHPYLVANNQKFLTVVPGINDLKNNAVNDVANVLEKASLPISVNSNTNLIQRYYKVRCRAKESQVKKQRCCQ